MKLDKSKYISWDELISRLDKKIESRWKLLKKKLKDDMKSFNTKKSNLVCLINMK